jgi:hypothetical protein
MSSLDKLTLRQEALIFALLFEPTHEPVAGRVELFPKFAFQ